MTLWRGENSLILASQSHARQTLLAHAGIAFEAMPANIDERGIQARSGVSAPGDIARLLAEAKALAVSSRRAGHVVIGADQTLALGQRLFSKPNGRAQAAEQLRALAGKTHELFSGVAVALDDRVMYAHVAVARLTMRPLSENNIAAYLDAAGDIVTSSVGAYQLERFGVHLFEHIDGDHFTILGLPLLPLIGFLRSQSWLAI
jgi:nucleoside triphosphate pyrophosphatase